MKLMWNLTFLLVRIRLGMVSKRLITRKRGRMLFKLFRVKDVILSLLWVGNFSIDPKHLLQNPESGCQ